MLLCVHLSVFARSILHFVVQESIIVDNWAIFLSFLSSLKRDYSTSKRCYGASVTQSLLDQTAEGVLVLGKIQSHRG